jgi:DNA-binding GntR family transcriptional regulator
VDNIPNRGFYSHVLNITELFELLTIRSGLDAIVAQNVAENCMDVQAEELEKFWLPFKDFDSAECFDSHDVKREYLKADRRFHELHYSLCSLGTLKKLSESSQILNRTFTCGLVRNASETFMEHKNICNAIKNKAPMEAFNAAYTHNSNTINNLKNFISQMKTMGLNRIKSPSTHSRQVYFIGDSNV